MAIIYVKKTGDDGTGNGDSDNPYLTITTAIANAGSSDYIDIGAGTYQENNIGSAVTLTGITIRTIGDGMVIISGSAGGVDVDTGNTIRPYSTWVIDGSTGSNLQNIEILGGSRSCVAAKSGTKSFSVKYCILTGRGDRKANISSDVTQFAVYKAGGSVATVKNCTMRNFWYGFNQAASNGGRTAFYNNICYNAGYSGSLYAGLYNNYGVGGSTFLFNTITDFTGGYAISAPADGTIVKNNLCAFIDVSSAGIWGDDESGGTGNFVNNNVYIEAGATTPTYGAYRDFSDTAIDVSNKEIDPGFLKTEPWNEQFTSEVSGDFSLKPNNYHYPGSARDGDIGSDLSTAGISISNLTVDFSGSTRTSTPTIGALEVPDTFRFAIAPTATGLEDSIKKDFTINHYNRISKEIPRNVDQIPFSRLIKGPANLKDAVKSYRLTKESK